LAVGEQEGPEVADRAAIDRRRSKGASQCQLNVAMGTDRQAAKGDLERCGSVRLRQQPGSETKGVSVGGSRSSHPDCREPWAAEVLNQGKQSCRQYF
jgi:hypothetical protein